MLYCLKYHGCTSLCNGEENYSKSRLVGLEDLSNQNKQIMRTRSVYSTDVLAANMKIRNRRG